MSLHFINAREAKTLADQGAALIDVREAHEFARENIPGSRNHPLSRLGGAQINSETPVVFFCQSGGRTRMSAHALAYVTEAPVYIMDGGIMGWKMAGYPVARG